MLCSPDPKLDKEEYNQLLLNLQTHVRSHLSLYSLLGNGSLGLIFLNVTLDEVELYIG